MYVAKALHVHTNTHRTASTACPMLLRMYYLYCKLAWHQCDVNTIFFYFSIFFYFFLLLLWRFTCSHFNPQSICDVDIIKKCVCDEWSCRLGMWALIFWRCCMTYIHTYIYIYINSHRNDETTIAMTPHKPFATKSSLYKLNYLSDIRFNFITAKRLSIEWKHPTIYSQLIARCSPTVTMHKIWWERFDGMMRAATTAILPCMCLKLSEIWLTTVKWRYDSFMIIVH